MPTANREAPWRSGRAQRPHLRGTAFTQEGMASQLLAIGQGCVLGWNNRPSFFAGEEGVEQPRIRPSASRPDSAGRWRFGPPQALVVMPPVPHWRRLHHMAGRGVRPDPATSSIGRAWASVAGNCGNTAGSTSVSSTSLIGADRRRLPSAESCVVVAKAQLIGGQGVVFSLTSWHHTPQLSKPAFRVAAGRF